MLDVSYVVRVLEIRVVVVFQTVLVVVYISAPFAVHAELQEAVLAWMVEF